jgi:hypothetical protein
MWRGKKRKDNEDIWITQRPACWLAGRRKECRVGAEERKSRGNDKGKRGHTTEDAENTEGDRVTRDAKGRKTERRGRGEFIARMRSVDGRMRSVDAILADSRMGNGAICLDSAGYEGGKGRRDGKKA